jgi:L-2-hydroxyglutarate oxidase LhgO
MNTVADPGSREETLIVPVSREEKERIEARARAARVSIAQWVREAIELAELEERTTELEPLLAEMERSAARAHEAIDEAQRRVDRTLADFETRRRARP